MSSRGQATVAAWRSVCRSSPAFIGRRTEVAAIARLLADPACRLLTLLGPGGIGKTRLALAVAATQTAVFTDGVAFVALAAIGTPDQIVSAIGETLGLAFTGQSNPTGALLSHLRARHMLLVLDNVEHLLAGADLIAAILAHAPQVTLLITSRERLNLQAEWLFDVQGLAYPPEDQHGQQRPEDLTEYTAIQLFVQRATQVQPRLELSESALTAIAQICQQVAGMPLAIELAAAGVRMLPIAEIERQIRSSLDVLATTLRDVLVRHRSMRAVFDHSWRLLSEPERTLLSWLAVFRGGWAAAAAEQVAGATLPALAALIDKSLVRQDSAAKRSSVEPDALNTAAEPRFVLLEPIREYALEQLAPPGEALAIQRAHAGYYLALADFLEGNLTDAAERANESLILFRTLQADASRAEVLVTIGKIVLAQGDQAAAYQALTESLRLALALGPRLVVTFALDGLAGVMVARDQSQLAVQLLGAASALRAQMGAPVRPVDQAAIEQALASARTTLGANAFAAVWAEAQVLPLEQILNAVLSAATLDMVRDRSGR
jgi:predicted ATPase